MKYIGVILAFFLLSAIVPTQATINTCDGHIDILNVVQINADTLAIDLKLTTNGVNLNLIGVLGVDVNVIVRQNNVLVFVGTCFANFQGLSGEIVTVHIDVGNVSLLANADITVRLGNLHIDLDLGLNILLGQDYVCHLLNGVVQTVTSLVNNLLGTPNCIISIVNTQVLAGNKIQVSLQLQSAVLGGLSLDVNVDLLNRLGVIAHIATQHVTFTGVRGQIVVCILDVSGAVNLLLDPEVNLQLCVNNINVNVNLNVIVDIGLSGLDNCLDSLLTCLGLPHIFVSSGAIEISAVAVVGNNLQVTLLLDTDVNVGSAVAVDLNVIVFSNLSILLRQLVPCNFVGLAGELVTLTIDLSGLDLSAQLFVFAEVADLNVAVHVNLDLCHAQLFSLLNGCLTPVM